MYCKHCRKEIISDVVFCYYCGKRVNPTRVAFKDKKHYDVINAYTILEYCESGYYFICDLEVGFVILDYNNKRLATDTLFEDIITEGRENVDSILVKKNGKWGLINPLTGIIICDFIYDDIAQIRECYNNEKGEIAVYSNGLWGKIDCAGNIILPIIYDDISSCDRVKYQGLWGCVRNGEQIVPCEYIKLGGGVVWGDNSYKALEPSQYKDGKWGIIEDNGRICLEFEYDEIHTVDDYVFEIRKGDKWGILYYSELIPCEFSLDEIKKKRRSLDRDLY